MSITFLSVIVRLFSHCVDDRWEHLQHEDHWCYQTWYETDNCRPRTAIPKESRAKRGSGGGVWCELSRKSPHHCQGCPETALANFLRQMDMCKRCLLAAVKAVSFMDKVSTFTLINQECVIYILYLSWCLISFFKQKNTAWLCWMVNINVDVMLVISFHVKPDNWDPLLLLYFCILNMAWYRANINKANESSRLPDWKCSYSFLSQITIEININVVSIIKFIKIISCVNVSTHR